MYSLKHFNFLTGKKSTTRISSTVKPDLTTIYEQRPPVNNGQFESSMASLNLSFIGHLCQTAAFFRSQGWPLYTGLTALKSQLLDSFRTNYNYQL